MMISFENVNKEYKKGILTPKYLAVNDLSFSVQRGETLGLIGPNGAGKSTSIRLLMDFIRPDNGVIKVFGDSTSHPQHRSKIGYLPEIANFPSNLNVLDLLRFTAKTCSVDKNALRERSKEMLSLLDLWEKRNAPLRSFSKGMQQRANFAIALINDPELLILDEPMSGLDPLGRKIVSDLIAHLKSQGKTILFCSHILYDVDRLVDNILLLHHGKKLFYGRPVDLVIEENVENISDAFTRRVTREVECA
jgi:ABC-2 type transport system ATP-binding protein